jgi:hypothetical protein
MFISTDVDDEDENMSEAEKQSLNKKAVQRDWLGSFI